MQRDLFGGAMRCCMPLRFVDVSTFRQVPDNQEVFSDEATGQSVIIEILEFVSDADLAAHAAATGMGGAAAAAVDPPRYFFNDLAEANGAQPGDAVVVGSSSVPPATGCPHLPAAQVELYRLEGTQRVPKFNEPAATASVVGIALYNVRLRGIATDIVISMNVPRGGGGGGGGSGGGGGGAAATAASAVAGSGGGEGATAAAVVAAAAAAVGAAAAAGEEAKMDLECEGPAALAGDGSWNCGALVRSLEVKDWSLFG